MSSYPPHPTQVHSQGYTQRSISPRIQAGLVRSLSYAWPGQLAYLVLKLKEVAAAGCQGQEADCQGGEVASAGVKLVLRVADGNIS